MKKITSNKINSKITVWGNSYGLRLPKNFANSLGVDASMPVQIIQTSPHSFEVKEVKNDEIISLETFMESFKDKDFQIQEYDWGKPMGKEIW